MNHTTTDNISMTKWHNGVIDISVPDKQVTYRIEPGGKVFHVVSEYWATKPSRVLVECASLEEAYAEVFRLIIE